MHDKLALENTEQAGPLNLCTKPLIEIPFIMTARDTDGDGGAERFQIAAAGGSLVAARECKGKHADSAVVSI